MAKLKTTNDPSPDERLQQALAGLTDLDAKRLANMIEEGVTKSIEWSHQERLLRITFPGEPTRAFEMAHPRQQKSLEELTAEWEQMKRPSNERLVGLAQAIREADAARFAKVAVRALTGRDPDAPGRKRV